MKCSSAKQLVTGHLSFVGCHWSFVKGQLTNDILASDAILQDNPVTSILRNTHYAIRIISEIVDKTPNEG
jgi:hypothetical protein